ncbi:MAG: DUF4178 domain-containing protein [Bernardetiaceae bacterium]|jgi:hypothetical protein|nr:DUF4178 domain-containing protein [Bernardetiaceae bacterium]
MFNFFNKNKKEKPGLHYDPTNIKITDIRPGFLLDYDFKTWEVADEFEYDWGDQYFTYEYKLQSGGEVMYVHVDPSQPQEAVFTTKILFGQLGEAVARSLRDTEQPPSQITLGEVTFYRDKESFGFFRSTAEPEDSATEMAMWEYYDQSGQQTLVIFQWAEEDYEASVGRVEASAQAVSNILPRDEKDM